MADNVTLNQGTGGPTVGADEISGVKYQRVKLIHGIDGVNSGDVASVNPLPITFPGSATAAFGEGLTVEHTPVVQAYLERINDSRFWNLYTGSGGSVTVNDGYTSLDITTTSGSYVSALTRSQVSYQPGQGVTTRFTVGFDTGAVASSLQLVGPYHAEDGFGIGYNGTALSTFHRYGRKLEIQALQVTGAAGGSENATITIDGQGHTVPLTTGTVQQNAREIAEFGTGYAGSDGTAWLPYQLDDTVYFIRQTHGNATGSMTFSSATATGSFSETQQGANGTEDWVAQASWNIDTLDGTGQSGMTLAPANISPYEIRYGWLGVAGIVWCVYADDQGAWYPFHFKPWSNTASASRATLSDPRVPIAYSVASLGSTTALSMKGICCHAGVHGIPSNAGPQDTAVRSNLTVSSTELPTASVQAAPVDVALSKINRRQLLVTSVTVANTGTKDIIGRLYRGTPSNLTGYNFQQNDTHEAMWFDASATAITGSLVPFKAVGVSAGTNETFVFDPPLTLARTETLIATAQTPASSTTVTTTINCIEDL